jgi:FkbM family methyltransferase
MKKQEPTFRMRSNSEVWLKEGYKRWFEALNGLRFLKNKFQVIVHIFGLYEKSNIIYYLKNGLKLKVSNTRQDRTMILSINDIFVSKQYSAPQSQRRKIILDLGANIGAFSFYTALENPNAKIYSFEPYPDNFVQLCDNVKINKLEGRIFPLKEAIAKENGKLTFYCNQVSSRAHSLFNKTGEKITVESTNLETIFSRFKIQNCDILKMDIEGAEYEVLYNCPNTLFEKIDIILVECHSIFVSINCTYTQGHMREFLFNKGFKVIRDKGPVLIARKI